jgi:ABC-type transport system involved in cytochrome c biogenesis permease subunit
MSIHRAIAMAMVLGLLGGAGRAGAEGVSSLTVWQHIPVLENGRVMPIDSYARHTLLSLSGKSTFDRKPAVQWLARVLFAPETTKEDKILLVNNPEVAEAIGLGGEGRRRYSYAELAPQLADLSRLARAAWDMDDEARSPVEKELIRLYNNITLYSLLRESFAFAVPQEELQVSDPQLRKDLGLSETSPITFIDLRQRLSALGDLLEKHKATPQDQWSDYQKELFRLSSAFTAWSRHHRDVPPAIIPLSGHAGNMWVSPWDVINMGVESEEAQRELSALADMAGAYRAGQQVAFDIATRSFISSVGKQAPEPAQLKTLKLEVRYNKSEPFYKAEMFYGFAFLIALLSVALRKTWLYRGSLLLVALALVPHTYGIVARMVIMGRPPVTNLYATFIFVSWVCVLLGLTVEFFQRNRLGLITASAMGLALLLTSGRFGSEGDTMGVVVAVLDSNFWLATHVVCISIGYAGCCVAGLLGHIYLLQALRRAPGDAALAETYNATFGALAFGLIFSFLGTMLGGVWADQSWGRFWGWDPKENGALVIVLWSAILFHARAGKIVGPLGFAAGSVLGVIWVLLAWLGINLLGVGLHSYGFTSGLALGLGIACSVEVLFVTLTVPFARRAESALPAAAAGSAD